ncbi:MAG: hypothetical protein NTZ26_02215 [Candidatus Aminicenantes bacterium]|nr:hypothetical protein [Candidatus Aminicenantes bacterium]
MKRHLRLFVAVGLVALAAFACQKKTQVQGVGLGVSFGEAKLSDNLITDVVYTWKTSGDFKPLDRDYSVFVHFWHNANLIVQDDYVPDVPTSKWEKGKEYIIRRRVFLPKFIDEFDPSFKGEETLRLSVGFYNPFDRTGNAQREVLSKKLKVTPPPLGTPEVIYESGWYDLESDQNSPLKQWRWTAKEAACVVDNPKRDALLVIRGGTNKEIVKDQKISFRINGLPFDEFIPQEAIFEKTYTIKKEMVGDKDEFILTIAVDKPFVPAKVIPNSKDGRELGVMVGLIYYR